MRKLLEKVELLRIEGIGGYIVVSLLTVLMILANEEINKRIGFGAPCTGAYTTTRWDTNESSYYVYYNVSKALDIPDKPFIDDLIHDAAARWNEKKPSWCPQWPIWVHVDWGYTANVWYRNDDLEPCARTIVSKSSTGRIVRVITMVNTLPPYTTECPELTAYCYNTVVRHEWGHWFSLKDLIEGSQWPCLMYRNIWPGGSEKKITDDEVQDVAKTYGCL